MLLRRWLHSLTSLVLAAAASMALAQVPIPMQEQVRLFNSLPPSQQQSLIRELQRQLPPAQRDAILGKLQGQGGAGPAEMDPEAEAALADALALQNGAEDSTERVRESRLRPRDTLVLRFELTGEANLDTPGFQERLAKGNPYALDNSGMLYLPGVPAIALAGLNVDEATVRVQAEPALAPFTVTLTFLPLEPVGTAALKPFGYDLFERPARSFAPVTDIPVPVDYVLGPGDTVNVQLFGSQNAEYFLTVSREGSINFPEIGPVNVSGLSFAEMRDTINERVTQQMIGVRASITLGELRSIRVVVLGDVVRPGSYSVSGLATITNALFAGGGVKTIGDSPLPTPVLTTVIWPLPSSVHGEPGFVGPFASLPRRVVGHV
jgi:protein involved in polysaccharide export with SLBB domain